MKKIGEDATQSKKKKTSQSQQENQDPASQEYCEAGEAGQKVEEQPTVAEAVEPTDV